MSSIDTRLSRLEQKSRGEVQYRTKDERDAAYRAFIDQIRPVAETCNSPEDLSAHIKTIQNRSDDCVVSLDHCQRSDAVRNAFARSIFDKVCRHIEV